MSGTENVSPNGQSQSQTQARPCWRCRKCQALQSRIQAVGNEYESLRKYLLKDAKEEPGNGACSRTDAALREEITQLRITIDTIVRSQMFEILDS